jgi:hypothetical protein
MDSFFLFLSLEKQADPRPESQAVSGPKPGPVALGERSERLDAAEHRATIKKHEK